MNNHPVFEQIVKVTHEHIDALDHVNNVVYVQFMQDVADKHWHSIPLSKVEQELIWVVRRHEIDYLCPAVLHDDLLVRTWTGEHGAVSWNRHYEIIRIADRKKIIAAKSVWILLDRQTNRPRRIDDAILQRFG